MVLRVEVAMIDESGDPHQKVNEGIDEHFAKLALNCLVSFPQETIRVRGGFSGLFR